MDIDQWFDDTVSRWEKRGKESTTYLALRYAQIKIKILEENKIQEEIASAMKDLSDELLNADA